MMWRDDRVLHGTFSQSSVVVSIVNAKEIHSFVAERASLVTPLEDFSIAFSTFYTTFVGRCNMPWDKSLPWHFYAMSIRFWIM